MDALQSEPMEEQQYAFTERELARLARYRSAVQTGFYTHALPEPKHLSGTCIELSELLAG